MYFLSFSREQLNFQKVFRFISFPKYLNFTQTNCVCVCVCVCVHGGGGGGGGEACVCVCWRKAVWLMLGV